MRERAERLNTYAFALHNADIGMMLPIPQSCYHQHRVPNKHSRSFGHAKRPQRWRYVRVAMLCS